MATLRYVALSRSRSGGARRLLSSIPRHRGVGAIAEGDISITDGYYNLTFFKHRPALGEMKMDLGLHHIGLEVDNLEEAKGKFLSS